MAEIWRSLTTFQQDLLIALALLLPIVVIGWLVRRGFAPGPLVRAILRRYAWANALFVLLVSISIGMGLGITAQEHALRGGIARAAEKFDLVVTAPGSELTMMLAAVYLRATDAPLLDGHTYGEIAAHERVVLAAPLAFGDSVGGAPVVGTTADFVRHLSQELADGRLFAAPFEAVLGAAAPFEIGAHIAPAHGHGDAADGDAHDVEFAVVGRMVATGSPWDHAVIVPIEAVWQIHGLADGHRPEAAGQLGPPFDAEYFPGTPAVIVAADGLAATYTLKTAFTRDAQTMAFFPGAVLATLYRVMGDVRQAMSAMATVSQVLVALSVLLGLFILSQLFQRQLALLRAIGAPRRFVFSVVWSYAVTLLCAGALLGAALGFAAAAALSFVVTQQTGVLVQAQLGWRELHMLLGFTAISCLLSLLPAFVILRKSVVASLRA